MRRGFTFIELAVVIPLFMVLCVAMVELFMVFNAELQTAVLQGDTRLELRRAAARIYGRAAATGWQLDADNRGLRLGDGTRVRWEGDKLLLAGQSLLERPVRLFLATAAHRQLVLTVELEAPHRWRGEPFRQRMVFEGGPR